MSFIKKHVEKELITKVAKFSLPKDISEWNEKILSQFFTEVDYLPKGVAVDVVITSIDEESGYAKGSVVVSVDGKQVNYPVIVADYDLSPFDTFVVKDGDDHRFIYSNKANISKALMSDKFGKLDNYLSGGGDGSVKMPGNITPKSYTTIAGSDAAENFLKTSYLKNWKAKASIEDVEKFASQISDDEALLGRFYDNTGNTIVDTVEELRKVASSKKKAGKVNALDTFNIKTAATISSTEMMNPSSLSVIKTPGSYNLYLPYVGTKEDAEAGIGYGGYKVTGVLLPKISFTSDGVVARDHVFISKNANIDSVIWNQDLELGKLSGSDSSMSVEQVLASIKTKSSGKRMLAGVGYTGNEDRVHSPNLDAKDSYKKYGPVEWDDCNVTRDDGMAFITKLNGKDVTFEIRNVTANKVQGDWVYRSKGEMVVIPSSVKSVTVVEKVEDPVYSAILGKNDKVVLVPKEGLITIPTSCLDSVSYRDFIGSGNKQSSLVPNMESITVKVASRGFSISGDAVNSVAKVANLNASEMTTEDAKMALSVMGVSKEASYKALLDTVKLASLDNSNGVTIYGVNSDYISSDALMKKESSQRVSDILDEYASSIRKDLTKVASELDDPDAVDVVLSLNFINGDNVKDYIDYVDEFRDVSNKLSELLTASRMGLKSIDDGSTKKAVEGLESVIEDLNNLRYTVTPNS